MFRLLACATAALALTTGEARGLERPAALDAPIELPSAPPQKFTRNVLAGDKVRASIFVPSYRVSFMVSARATASTTDTRATAETVLSGAEPELIQAITDRAYADFVERLTAAGFTVITPDAWRATGLAIGFVGVYLLVIG